MLSSVEAALCDHFGQSPERASVSFLGVEPIQVLRFEANRFTTLVTLGMARRPMTNADATVLSDSGPRAELLLQLRGNPDLAWKQLALLAAAPVVEGVVYSAGMTVDLGSALAPESVCTGGVVTESDVAAIHTPGGVVNILRLLPATSTELAWSRVRGSAALIERWSEQGTDLCELTRVAVGLE